MTAQDLKNSILQQAIQGKLLPQNPADEPASELLKKIFAQRQKLIDEGKIKNPPQLPPISDDEKPFDIPDSWQWVRLGEIGTWGAGTTPLKSNLAFYKDATVHWLVTGDLNDGIIENIPGKISELALAKTSLKLNPAGSVLIAMYGATIGKVGILKFSATTNQACCACQTFDGVYNWYLFYFLMSQRKNFIKRGVGGAQPNISKEKIIATLIPLPSLAEQKRIVAKLEEILPLVERYGELEQRLTKLDKEFPDKLKKSLLQQAIQGKLTQQLSTDGDAKDLLEKIRAEKLKLIAEGKIKKEKPLPPISAEEIPFDIPDSWQWVRLGEIFNIRSSKRIHQSDWQSSGIPFLRGRELVQLSKFGKCDTDIYISQSLYQKLKNFGIPARGDILVSAVGTIGKVYAVKGNKSFYYKDAYVLCFENFGDLLPEFMKYAIESPPIQKQVHEDAMASTVKQLTIEKSKSIIFPLPPLAEQKRIVERLEELLPLCDRLREKFTD